MSGETNDEDLASSKWDDFTENNPLFMQGVQIKQSSHLGFIEAFSSRSI